MKTIQTELQKIADAIKGTESEGGAKTTQTLLAKIRDNIAGTTPSGEVKTTQVLLGEIAQAISDNPPTPAPSETFEVEMSISKDRESSTATYSSNKTFTEVMSAADNGDTVQVNLTYTQDGSAYPADVVLSGKITLSGLDVFVMLILISDGMYTTFAIALWAGNSENIMADTTTIPMFEIGAEST